MPVGDLANCYRVEWASVFVMKIFRKKTQLSGREDRANRAKQDPKLMAGFSRWSAFADLAIFS